MAYYRVSTDQQGRSGLGLEAQHEAINRRITMLNGVIVERFEEIESGRKSDRPKLAQALAVCRARRAVLIIAKLDRLARDTRFLLNVVHGTGEGGVVFCDLPDVPPGPVGKFLLTQMAAVAELEAGLISQRTKDALAAAKARGVKLGGPRRRRSDLAPALATATAEWTRQADLYALDVMPFIDAARGAGASSLEKLAEALMARGVRAPRGGERWSAVQVGRIITRAAAVPADLRRDHERGRA